MDKSFNLCMDEMCGERFSKYSYAFDKVFKNSIRPGNKNRLNRNRYVNNIDSKFSEALDELQIYSPLYKQLSQRCDDNKFNTINYSIGKKNKLKSFIKCNI